MSDLGRIRERGETMLVDMTVGVPEPQRVDLEAVKRELPHGEIVVHAVDGGPRAPDSEASIACVSIRVRAHDPGEST